MIFHYDPLNYHIEYTAERDVLYTCVRLDRYSPRIRYNLGDKGMTMLSSEMMGILRKHNVQLQHPPLTNLPLLFIWGRQGSSISFRGAKIAPENLGESIRRVDSLVDSQWSGINSKIAHYSFYQHEEKGITFTEMHLEFVKVRTFWQKKDKWFVVKEYRHASAEWTGIVKAIDTNTIAR